MRALLADMLAVTAVALVAAALIVISDVTGWWV